MHAGEAPDERLKVNELGLSDLFMQLIKYPTYRYTKKILLFYAMGGSCCRLKKEMQEMKQMQGLGSPLREAQPPNKKSTNQQNQPPMQ